MNFKQEIFAKNINSRCKLMARSEADVKCSSPELGEEIYRLWIQDLDATNPDDFDISQLIEELAIKYAITEIVANSLFEEIRQLILQYDELIDRAV